MGQEGAANGAFLTGVDQAIFSLHAAPGEATHAGQFQPAAGFDLSHHPTEGVHMGGQPARGWGIEAILPRQEGQQRSLARPLSANFWEGSQLFLKQRDRLVRKAGRAGCVEQLG